jgi:predicted transcriptional regulator
MNTHSKIIDALGGSSKVAELCEVTPSAVSQWREDGIPKARLMFLKLAKPDVFEALEAEDGKDV